MSIIRLVFSNLGREVVAWLHNQPLHAPKQITISPDSSAHPQAKANPSHTTVLRLHVKHHQSSSHWYLS